MGFHADLGFDVAALAVEDPQGAYVPGRVVEEQIHGYRVLTEAGPVWARAAGRLKHEATSRLALPAVGDYVLLAPAPPGAMTHVERLLPRRTRLVRKAVGGPTAEQVIAANVDVVFIVTSLNQDLSERRLERYLVAAWDGGAQAVVVLSKADLAGGAVGAEAVAERLVAGAALRAPVLPVSALMGEGLAALRGYLGRGRTGVFVGSSGVGKSTLINALLGGAGDAAAPLATQAVREDDDKGRHTTTSRSLWFLPATGGIIIDTPGMRELMPFADEAAVGAVFSDVEAVAAQCRFSDCRHAGEPGCAVAAAVAAGSLDASRLASYAKLLREQAYLARKQDARLAATERQKWKKISKAQRALYKGRR